MGKPTMNRQDPLERLLDSLHAAAIDDALIPVASGWAGVCCRILAASSSFVRPWPVPRPWGRAAPISSTTSALPSAIWPGVAALPRPATEPATSSHRRTAYGDKMASCAPCGLKARAASSGWWQRPYRPWADRLPAVSCRSDTLLVPGSTLHVHPVTVHQMEFGVLHMGALVLIDGLEKSHGPHARQAGTVLGLTHAERGVAPWLVESKTVPDIAALSGRAEGSIRTHLKSTHRKLGVSRRAELVRLGQSEHERAGCRRRL